MEEFMEAHRRTRRLTRERLMEAHGIKLKTAISSAVPAVDAASRSTFII